MAPGGDCNGYVGYPIIGMDRLANPRVGSRSSSFRLAYTVCTGSSGVKVAEDITSLLGIDGQSPRAGSTSYIFTVNDLERTMHGGRWRVVGYSPERDRIKTLAGAFGVGKWVINYINAHSVCLHCPPRAPRGATSPPRVYKSLGYDKAISSTDTSGIHKEFADALCCSLLDSPNELASASLPLSLGPEVALESRRVDRGIRGYT